MLLYHRLDGGRHGLWTYHDPEVCLTAVSCVRDPVALSAHWSSRLFKRNNQQLNWPAYSTATVMKRTLRAFTPRGDYQWFRSRTRSPRTQPLFGHTPKYRNNSHIGAYSLSDIHNRTFSNVILTRAASNIGRQHSWTCQILTVCRSASKCKRDQAASGDNKGISSPPCGGELACINHTRYPRQQRQYVHCALLPTRQRTIAPAAMPIKPQTLRRPAHWLSRKFIQPSAIQSACLFSLQQ